LKKFLVIAAALACLMIHLPVVQAQDTPAGGINGKWHFVLDTPGGERNVDAEFTVDNDGNVTGKWGTADVAGTWKEGTLALNFSFTSDEAGVTAPMQISGKLDGAAGLNGDWVFSEYNGTFKATRPAAEPAPAQAPSSQPQ
jgi:hypothetical protein